MLLPVSSSLPNKSIKLGLNAHSLYIKAGKSSELLGMISYELVENLGFSSEIF